VLNKQRQTLQHEQETLCSNPAFARTLSEVECAMAELSQALDRLDAEAQRATADGSGSESGLVERAGNHQSGAGRQSGKTLHEQREVTIDLGDI
jgi:hypothetical protein